VQSGCYRFNRTPFGVQGAPAKFTQMMSLLFKDMLHKDLMVYIDDLLIFSENFESHIIALQEVFDRLRNAGLRLHPKKCKFALPEITYLGHKISAKGIRVDESKIEAVKHWPVPKSVKEVRAFLGYCGYYRKFVK